MATLKRAREQSASSQNSEDEDYSRYSKRSRNGLTGISYDFDLEDGGLSSFQRLLSDNLRLQHENQMLRQMYSSVVGRVVAMEHHVAAIEASFISSSRQGPIVEVPEEVIWEIFRHLPLPTLLNSQGVCKRWKLQLELWLREIDLSGYYTSIDDRVVNSLCRFENLNSLSLSRCKEVTIGSIRQLASSLRHIQVLDLFGCQLKDFTVLHDFLELRHLRIGDCDADDKDLTLLPPHIKRLQLEWCLKLGTTGGLRSLASLTQLQDLEIAQNDTLRGLTLTLPESLVPSLKRLSVVRQALFREDELEALKHFTNLEVLEFYWVPFQGARFNLLGSLTKLHTLKLRRCQALSDGAIHFISANLKNLHHFELRGVHSVTDQGIVSLRRLQHLRVLHLRLGESIHSSALSGLNLEELYLIDAQNMTDGNFTHLLKNLATLQIFSIQHAQLLCVQAAKAKLARCPIPNVYFNDELIEKTPHFNQTIIIL